MNIIKKFNEYKLLLERNLNFGELNKNNRWDILFNKLKNDEYFNVDFTDENGEKIKDNVKILNRDYILYEISKNGNKSELDVERAEYFFEEGNGYYDIFEIISNGKKYYIRLNDIVKNKEFGSSGGSSSGTIDTLLKESMFIFFFALKKYLNIELKIDIAYIQNILFKKGIYTNGFKDIIKEKVIKNILLPIQINEEIINNELDSDWLDSYVNISDDFYEFLENNEKYLFVHNTYKNNSIPHKIYSIFYKKIKDYKLNFRINVNKWNPSDIYIINYKYIDDINMELYNIISSKDINKLEHLNTLMTEWFNTKKLMGISVKKTKKPTQTKNIKNEINIKEEDFVIFKYDKSTSSIDPFGIMSMYIHAHRIKKNKVIQNEILLSKNSTGNVLSNNSLEIMGLSSKYGRISFSYINYILSNSGLDTIPHYNTININNKELIDKISELYKDLKIKNKIEESKNNISDNRSKLISKYQSLLLVKILEDNKNINYKYKNKIISKTDFIITQLFNFGYSRNNIIFDTPPYYFVYSYV